MGKHYSLRDIVVKAIKKHHDTGISHRNLARKLVIANPGIFKDLDAARSSVRYYTGSHGDRLRKANKKIVRLNTRLLSRNYDEINPPSTQYSKAQKRKFDKTKKRFIITWGQCNTKVHNGFYKNMESYAKFINADIHIILGRYKNPTSIFSVSDKEYWVQEVDKYKDANRHNIHKYLSIMSDIKIQPTAINPMSGMEGVSGVNSCIFGSPKVQMQMIPVLQGNKPKMMLTTGACTLKNYTDSKAGKKGEFHHTLGFCIIEIKNNDTFFVRQVTADTKTGDFSDLYYRTQGGKVFIISEIEALIAGDLHIGKEDVKVMKARHYLLDKLKPNHVILHDVFDGDSISHHTLHDPFMQYGKELNGTNDLEKEIANMLYILGSFKKYKKVVVDKSNHDEVLDKWLKNEDWRKTPTPKNYKLYMQYATILLDQYEKDPNHVKGVIPYIINQKFPKYITLGRNDSYKVKDWELGQHGDIGSNGSKGSLQQTRRLNTKIVTAHTHSPARKDGALIVGTSTGLRIGYNIGASGWLQSDVIIHTDKKAQHINFINGEYTTFKYAK